METKVFTKDQLEEAASLLNLRTEVAQTAVSKLGKMFKITFLPSKDFKDKFDKSPFTSSTFSASVNG